MELDIQNLGRVRGSPLHVIRVGMEATGKGYWESVGVKNAVIIDIGGYIGDTAMLFANRGASRVYMFEPSKKYYDMACINLAPYSNIVTFNQAVGHRNGFGILSGSLMGKTLTSGKGEPVSIRAFNDLVDEILTRENCIDIVKMDCEDAERQIIEESNPRIFERIHSFWIEMHGSQDQNASLVEYLKELGYDLVYQSPHFFLKHNFPDLGSRWVFAGLGTPVKAPNLHLTREHR